MTTPSAGETAKHDVELKLTNTSPRRQNATQQQKNQSLSDTAAKMRERQAAEQQSEPEAPAPTPREDVESVEVKLTDGRKVLFGPPKGISLTMRIAMHFPEASAVIDRLARVLMSIQEIDGKKPISISNMVDLTRLANEVGDTGIDELNFWLQRYWGNIQLSDTQVLKKNLRG